MRIRWYLFFFFIAAAVLPLWLGLWLAWRSCACALIALRAGQLEETARLVLAEAGGVANLVGDGDERAVRGPPRLSDLRVSVIDSAGKAIAGDSPERWGEQGFAERTEVCAGLSGRIGRGFGAGPEGRDLWVFAAVPAEYKGGRVVLRLGAPAPEIAELRKTLWRTTLAVSVAAIALCGLAAAAAARSMARPLNALRSALERMASGDMSVGGISSHIEEMRLACRALNRTAGRLAASMEEIRRQMDETRTLFAAMAEGVLLVDAEGGIVDLNRAAARLLETDEASVRGRTIHEVARHPDLQRFVSEILETGGETEKEVTLLGAEDKYLQLRGSVVERTDGKGRCALIIINDVTRLKRLERVRRDFVANVSHELKTPITTLRGCVDALAPLARLDEEAGRFLAMMSRNIERLGCLAEDVMCLARMEHETEAGRILLQPGSVGDVIRNAARRHEHSARAKKVAISVECPGDIRAMMHCELLEQAVGNLIDNAVKYGPEGGRVTVSAAASGGFVAIRVQDEGPGIEKKHLTRIFERFYRVDPARSRAMGGTGLGLAIVKHITLAHRGSVSVQSEVGRGSVFEIRIPCGCDGAEDGRASA